jgi:hypothetical protein
MLVIKEEEPNKPVNKGRRDSFTGRFKVEIPRKPERMKIMKAQNLLFLSLKIRYREEKTRIKNITKLR